MDLAVLITFIIRIHLRRYTIGLPLAGPMEKSFVISKSSM